MAYEGDADGLDDRRQASREESMLCTACSGRTTIVLTTHKKSTIFYQKTSLQKGW